MHQMYEFTCSLAGDEAGAPWFRSTMSGDLFLASFLPNIDQVQSSIDSRKLESGPGCLFFVESPNGGKREAPERYIPSSLCVMPSRKWGNVAPLTRPAQPDS